MRTTRLLLLAAAVSACAEDHVMNDVEGGDAGRAGDGATPDAGVGLRGGGRLRPKVQVERGGDASDGRLVAWYDTELDADCLFVRDVDGAWRCLPFDPQGGGLDVYPSASCDEGTGVLAVLVPHDGERPDCSPRYVAYLAEGAGCGEESAGRVLRITGPAAASQQTHPYVKTFFGDCNARPAPPAPPDPGPQWVYCAYEAVPRSALVTAEAETRDLGGLRQLVLRGADGAVEPRALLHPELDTPLQRDTWGGDTLVPVALQLGGDPPRMAADAACTRPAVCLQEPPSACAPLVVMRPDDCSARTFELGARVGEVHACDGPAGPGDASVCFAQVRELPALPYAEARLGEGRLRPLWIAHAGVPVQPTASFHDEVLDATCRARRTADGRVRCVPADDKSSVPVPSPDESRGWLPLFADAACASPIGHTYVPVCDEAPPAFRDGLDGIQRMRPAGERAAGRVYTGFVVPMSDRVIGCRERPDAPAALFAAETVRDDELAEVEEVVRD